MTSVVKCLTQEQKDWAVAEYVSKERNQKRLASNLRVSERTINRLLNEAGVATAVPRLKGEAYQVMQVLKEFNIEDAKQLRVMLTKPDVSHEDVQNYLNDCTKDQLARLFYTSGLVKLTEIATDIHTRKREEAQERVVL